RGHLDAQLSLTELVTRALRQALNRATADLERGQVFLASIGSVAPFVGLFGTVWGIYHALAAIGTTGQASLDKVAGPVGEALIMTAIGLFTAIPAVLAYNAFNRVQRLIIADLDGFAHDLLMYFTMGSSKKTKGNL
ncbi:MAG TPA: MotA/TolQ/ExbB proton channel family protein, partial [Pseudomonadales bacterium]|nr:MotA/TolQ/ExbB proton channel family protein [Pseudomonadales bacterium]